MNLFGNPVAGTFLKHVTAANKVVSDSSLPAATQELVRLRASQINGCGFCTDMHTKDAAHAGESQLRLNLVAAWIVRSDMVDKPVAFEPRSQHLLGHLRGCRQQVRSRSVGTTAEPDPLTARLRLAADRVTPARGPSDDGPPPVSSQSGLGTPVRAWPGARSSIPGSRSRPGRRQPGAAPGAQSAPRFLAGRGDTTDASEVCNARPRAKPTP